MKQDCRITTGVDPLVVVSVGLVEVAEVPLGSLGVLLFTLVSF